MKQINKVIALVWLASVVGSISHAQISWSGGGGVDNSVGANQNWVGGVAPSFTGAEAGSTNSLIFSNAVNVSVNLGTGTRRGVSNITFMGPNVGAFDFTNTGRWVLSYGGKVSMDSNVTNAIKIGRIGFGTNAGGGTYTLENNATLSTATMSNVSFVGANTNTSTMILTGSNTGTNRFDSASGNVSIIKNGTGRWDLSSVSTSGNATINEGTIGLSGNNALGAGAITINGGTIGSVGSSARTLTNAVTLGGNFQLGGLGQSTTISGNWNLGGLSRTITLGNSATFSGAFTNGALSLINASSSTPNFTLSGASNTFTSLTIGGTVNLQVGSDTALGSAPLTVNGGSISANGAARTITNAITLNGDLGLNSTGGANQLTVASNLDLGSATRTFTAVNTSAISGAISGSGGSLIKAGSGLLNLNSANTYSGNTTVAAGTLALGASGSLGGGSLIEVQSGATLDASAKSGGLAVGSSQTLKNNGTVTGTLLVNGGLQGGGTNGAVTLNSGSLLNPGNSPGNLTATSAIWNSGATYNWEITSLTGDAGTNWDLFTVSGALNLSNLSSSAQFNLTLDSAGALAGFSNSGDYSWTIAKAASITGLTSTTAGTDISSLFNIAAGNFNSGTGPTNGFKVFVGETTGGYTNLNLMAVPEPSAGALLGLGMAALVAVRSFRRRSV